MTSFGNRQIGEKEKVKSDVSIWEVWRYDCTINDNREIRRKLPSGEENNDFFPTYIKYNILVCHPVV